MFRSACLVLPLFAAAVTAQQANDDRLAGYAAAVLERELRLPGARVSAHAGVLTVEGDVPEAERQKVREALLRIAGVVGVELAGTAPEPGRTDPGREGSASTFLARQQLVFEPLRADPRWPHFSATYQAYRGNDDLRNVGAVSFGESFSLYRHAGRSADWDVGLQAGVFSIFDFEAPSVDLVNADYFVAAAFAWRSGDWSLLGRAYHQSSHLGDEYLLRTGAERKNLSYEVLHALASWDAASFLRLYGGGGWIAHSYTPLERWMAQAGTELLGKPFGQSGISPVAAVDVQCKQQSGWDGDVSARAGLRFEDPAAKGMRMELLLEYYRGQSPNGQFAERDVEFWGLGVHFYF